MANLKGKEKVEIVYTRQQKANALEVISVELSTIQRRSENPKEKASFRDRPAFYEGIP